MYMKTNSQKGNSVILVILLILLLAGAVGTAVYFWQSLEKEKAVTAAKMSGEKSATPSENNTNITVTNTGSTSESKKPVVIYSPNGLFNDAEIVEIEKKMTNPFVDWGIENKQMTVSIMVEKPTPAIPGYRYKVTYINEGGGNGGFLYGTTTPLEWWLPECYGGCSFSADFKAKYPEIVEKMSH
jgi:hypothetical protein